MGVLDKFLDAIKLNDDYDEVLDEIGNVIAEMDYYNNTNKQKNFINGSYH